MFIYGIANILIVIFLLVLFIECIIQLIKLLDEYREVIKAKIKNGLYFIGVGTVIITAYLFWSVGNLMVFKNFDFKQIYASKFKEEFKLYKGERVKQFESDDQLLFSDYKIWVNDDGEISFLYESDNKETYKIKSIKDAKIKFNNEEEAYFKTYESKTKWKCCSKAFGCKKKYTYKYDYIINLPKGST